MGKFKFESRKVKALLVEETYGGLLEGTYKEANRYILGEIEDRVQRVWGTRPTLVRKPEDMLKKLPKYTIYAWIDDIDSPGEDDDGRELVYIYFSDSSPIDHALPRAMVSDEEFDEHSSGYGW